MKGPLINILTRSINRRKRFARMKRGLVCLAIWLFAVLCALILDSAWSLMGYAYFAEPMDIISLPTWFRLMLLISLGLGALAMLWSWSLPRRWSSWAYQDEARALETFHEIPSNRLVNAVDFLNTKALNTHSHQDAFARQLTERVTQKADALASELHPEELHPISPVIKRTSMVALLSILFLIPAIIWPNQSYTAIQRLVTPWQQIAPLSMHPPVVMISDTMPIEDDQFMVMVIQSHEDHQAQIVLTDKDHPLHQIGEHLNPYPSSIETTDLHHLYWQSRISNAPLKFFIVSQGTWRGPFEITPRLKPRLENITVEIFHDGNWVKMPYPTQQQYVADAHSRLRVTAQSSDPSAWIDLSEEESLEYIYRIEAGPQTLKIALTNPDRMASKDAIQLSIYGRTPDVIGQASDPQMQDSPEEEAITQRIANTQDATDGNKAEDMQKENQGKESQMAERTGKGLAQDAMDQLRQMNDASAGGEREDQPEIEVMMASGTSNQNLTTSADTNTSSQERSQQAPKQYQALVESYFELKGQADTEHKESP